MDQGNRDPCPRVSRHPVGYPRILGFLIPAGTQCIKFHDMTGVLEERGRPGGTGASRHLDRGPVPARLEHQLARVVRHQQNAGRRIGNIRDRLDHPFVERRAVRAGPANRIGEANPLRSIVIAVLEEILGQLDLHPGAELAGGEQQQRADCRAKKETDLGQARIVAADDLQRGRDHDHHQQIAADRNQRQRAEGHAARKLQGPLRVAQRCHCQYRGNYRHHRPTHGVQFHRRLLGQIGDRVEVEIIGPDRGQRRHRQPDAPARFRRGDRIQIVDQHQRADGEDHPEYQRGVERNPFEPRASRKSGKQRIDQRLADQNKGQCGIDDVDGLGFIAPFPGAQQNEHEGQPAEIAQCFRKARNRGQRSFHRDRKRPEAGQRDRNDQPYMLVGAFHLALELPDRQRTEKGRGNAMSEQADIVEDRLHLSALPLATI